MVSSPGIVKIVVRQATGKEGGPVPTLAVAPSPRVAPLQFTPVRTPLTVSQRTPGPATATYTMAPPRIPSASPALPQPPRTILKVVQAPPPPVVQQPGENGHCVLGFEQGRLVRGCGVGFSW